MKILLLSIVVISVYLSIGTGLAAIVQIKVFGAKEEKDMSFGEAIVCALLMLFWPVAVITAPIIGIFCIFDWSFNQIMKTAKWEAERKENKAEGKHHDIP